MPITPRFGKTVEINALWISTRTRLAAIAAKVGSRRSRGVLVPIRP